MTNFKSWLETFTGTKIIIAIVQPLINDVPTMLYLSTHEFYPNLDNDATKAVKGVIKDEVSLSESISTDYTASISYGDISIANNAGEYDAWLSSSYIWANRPISVYLGALPDPYTSDLAFPTLADFELIFSGVVADVDSRDTTTLSIKIRDNLQRLNTSISESLLGNYNPTSLTNYTNPYSNNLKPLCFGEVHNITPMLTSPALLEYMVHLAEVEAILEVRDNGVPVSFTQTGVPAGSFRLLASPNGTITCSVQGAKQTNYISSNTTGYTYTNTAANTIATILRSYGNTVPYTDIDSDSFSNLGQQPIGVYYSDRVNVLSACQELAKGCGLVLSASRTGKLKLKDLDVPEYDSIWSPLITSSDIFYNSLQISEKLPVVAGYKIGYAKNWTIQNNLVTAIPPEHKDLYSSEYLEANATDVYIKNSYSVTTEPQLEQTYLIQESDAIALANKKLNLFKTPRKVFTMRCTAKWLYLEPGDAVRLDLPRFGLSGGVFAQVISTQPNWLANYIDIGVLV